MWKAQEPSWGQLWESNSCHELLVQAKLQRGGRTDPAAQPREGGTEKGNSDRIFQPLESLGCLSRSLDVLPGAAAETGVEAQQPQKHLRQPPPCPIGPHSPCLALPPPGQSPGRIFRTEVLGQHLPIRSISEGSAKFPVRLALGLFGRLSAV